MSAPSLAQRVVAASVVPVPVVSGIRWRPASIADIDTVVTLTHAADRIDHPHYLTTRDEITDDFESSWVDLATDSLLGFTDGDVPIAFGMAILLPGQETLVRALLTGAVHPDARGRGIGRELLAWQRARGVQQLASVEKELPGWLITFAHESARSAARLYERAGLQLARHYLELHRMLGDPIPALDSPVGVSIRGYGAADHGALRVAKNDAFRDHWSSQPVNEESWARYAARSAFRPDLSFLAVDEHDAIVGFVMTEVDRDDWEVQGFTGAYIDLVGVAREWRGRRIASALLTVVLQACAAEGLERVILDVDSESLTGAVALYEGVGFRTLGRSMMFREEY